MATTDTEELKKQMAANSAAWHTADDAKKKRLEAANQELASQIGGMTFDSASGMWSSNGASSNSSSTNKAPAVDYSDYEPLNKKNYTGEGYKQQVAAQEQAIIKNPLMGTGHNDKEFDEKFGDIYDNAEHIPYSERVTPEGSSGADEGKLSDGDYAVVQYCKEQWAEADARYQQAVNSGNAALAAQLKEERDSWHVAAERVRANSGYSGGADGSMYIDLYGEALAGNMIAANDEVADYARLHGGNPTTLWDYYEQTGQYPENYEDYVWSMNGEDSSHLRDGGGQAARLEAMGLIAPSGGSSGGSKGSGSSSSEGDTTKPGGSTTPTAPEVVLPELPDFTVPGIPGEGDLTGQITDYSDYIKEIIAAQQEANKAALLQAYNENVNALDRAGVGLEKGYQDARNQTAGASDLAARNFNEMAVANGLNIGAAGQAALSRNIALQNNQNAINKQEAQSLADLQQQYANNETWYNSAIAQAEAEGKQQEAQLLYQEKIRVESATIDLMQQQFQNEVTQYQLQYQAMRDSVADAQWQQAFDMQYQQWLQDVEVQMAQLEMQKQALELQAQQYEDSLAQQDRENSFALQQYQDALAQQDWENSFALQQYQDALAQQGWENSQALASGLTTKPVLTYTQVMDAIENGNVTPTVKDSFEYYNGVPYDSYILQIEQQSNKSAIDAALANMKIAGANLTEIRAALRDAYYSGGLTESDYVALNTKYLGNGRA